MPTALRSRHSTASFAVVCGQCYADKSTDRDKVNADAIINNGRMPSSPIWGFSRCPKPTDWRANPDAETTDWRARRGRTAHRVRREGTATAVPYPYPLAGSRPMRFPMSVIWRLKWSCRQSPHSRQVLRRYAVLIESEPCASQEFVANRSGQDRLARVD